MFSFSISHINGNGIGPLLQSIAIIYICYLAIYKNIKIPSLVFLLYAIGSIIFSLRYYNLLQAFNTTNKISSNSYSIELIFLYITSLLCLITSILVINL
jgi:hypothetical protein